MRNFRITVNGESYDVAVEELGASQSSAPASPATAPVSPPQAAPKPSASAGNVSGTKVMAPMPGKIMVIKADVGASVKKGDVVVTLEAMKMENEILAPADGKIAVMAVNKGANVDTGDLLFSVE